LAAGCDDPQAEVQSGSPPVLLDPPGESAIGSIAWVDLDEVSEHRVSLQVRDEDRDEDLIVRWRVLHAQQPLPEFQSAELPGTASWCAM
jgi:hypothetical protein